MWDVGFDWFGTETANLLLCREPGVSTTVAVCHGEHAARSLCRSLKNIACPLSKRKNAYIVGKHWCPHRKNFSETPRKSVILAPFCKDRRGGFKYMNWWGTLLSAVRLHNVQLPLKTVWRGVEKVMPDLCPGLNFYFCALVWWTLM